MLNRNNILIIGGGGYIGVVVSELFLKKKYKVYNVDKLIYKNQNFSKKILNNKNLFFYNYNFSQTEKIIKIIKNNNIKNILFLAGLVGDPITKKYSSLSKKVNYNYILKFLKTIKNLKNLKNKKFIFVSTCSNYGLVKNKLANEKTVLKPKSLYAKQKVEIEKYLMKNKFVFCKTILRFATAFGVSSRMRFDLTINDFCKKFYEGNYFEIYDPLTWRPYCHVNDFSRAIFKVITSKNEVVDGEIFNVGSSKNNFRKIDILKKIEKKIKFKNYKIIKKNVDPRNYKVNFNKILKILKFKCKYTLNYGIAEILMFLKNKKYNVYDQGNFIIKKKI